MPSLSSLRPSYPASPLAISCCQPCHTQLSVWLIVRDIYYCLVCLCLAWRQLTVEQSPGLFCDSALEGKELWEWGHFLKTALWYSIGDLCDGQMKSASLPGCTVLILMGRILESKGKGQGFLVVAPKDTGGQEKEIGCSVARAVDKC